MGLSDNMIWEWLQTYFADLVTTPWLAQKRL